MKKLTVLLIALGLLLLVVRNNSQNPQSNEVEVQNQFENIEKQPATNRKIELSQKRKPFRIPPQNKVRKNKNVFLSNPLEIPYSSEETFLDPKEILYWTNKHRAKEGLEPLIANSTLSSVAQEKVSDMFDGDYFDHVSPQGIGPADLAKEFNYDYIMVGENLAKGNFHTNKKLVQAWMDSPGHRANIMKPGYRELGVAVGQTTDDRQEVWLAVQSFGTPKSLCPEPVGRDEIDSEKEEIEDLAETLKELRLELEDLQADRVEFSVIKEASDEYNELVREFNGRSKNLSNESKEFNRRVEKYNSCLTSYN